MFILLISFCANTVYAQQDVALRDSASGKHGMRGFVTFDPTIYQVQGQWRPKANDSLIANNKWYNNLVVGVSTGLERITDFHYHTSQIPFQAFVGYRFTPIHQLRLQGGMMSMEKEGTLFTEKSYSLEAQYLASMTNYNRDYKRNRFFDISTLVGLGMRHYKSENGNSNNPYLRTGLDLSIHLGPSIAIFMQPYVGMTSRRGTTFKTDDPMPYRLMYGADAGLAIAFDRDKNYYDSLAPMFRNIFVEETTGWGFRLDNFNIPQSGTNAAVSVGRWLTPMFGLRLGLMGQQSYWEKDHTDLPGNYTLLKSHASLAGRAELLFNLRNIKRSNREAMSDPKWEIDMSMGAMYGYNAKSRVPHTAGLWRCYYYGFTGALQGLLKVSPGTYIFVEPRYFANSYRVPYKNVPNKFQTVQDRFMALSVGTRIYATPLKERRDTLTHYTPFEPRWWFGVGAGGFKMFEPNRLQYKRFGVVQPSASFNVGYDVHKYATARIQVEWGNLARVNRVWKTNYQLIDVRAIYMLPFTNVMRGLERNTRMHLYFEAGPTFSTYIRQDNDHIQISEEDDYLTGYSHSKEPRNITARRSFGVMAGSLVSYDINRSFDVFAEMQGQVNLNKGFTPGSQPVLNNLKWGLSVGSRYYLPTGDDLEENHLNVPAWMAGWFFEGETGWAKPFGHQSGSMYKVSLGRWLNSVIGLRAGMRAQQQYYRPKGDPSHDYQAQLLAGVHVEALTSVLNWFPKFRDDEDGRLFDLNLFAGMVIGGQASNRSDVGSVNRINNEARGFAGMSLGAQALFRLVPNVQLYVEPSILTARQKNIISGIDHAYYPWGVSAGARITRPEDARYYRKVKYDGPVFEGGKNTIFRPGFWLAFELGGSKQFLCQKNPGKGGITVIQPTYSASLGYDITPLHTVRLQYENSVMNRVYEHPDGHRYNMKDLRALYMLNFTNLWRGTRNNSYFRFYPELGVAYSHKDYAVSKQFDGLNSMGVVAGMMAVMRVSRELDVTMESQIQQNFAKGYMNQHHDNEANAKWNFTVGTRYHIPDGDELKLILAKPDWMKSIFLETGYGMTMPIEDGSIKHRMGHTWQAAAGYWINRLIGVRAGLRTSRSYWHATKVPAVMSPYTNNSIHGSYGVSYLDHQWGARVEALINPLCLFNKRIELTEAPRFDFNVGLGFDVAGSSKAHATKHTIYRKATMGFAASAQALYRLSEIAQIYIQPSYHTVGYKTPAGYDTRRASDRMFDVAIGTRISRLPSYDRRLVVEAMRTYDKCVWVSADVQALKFMHYTHAYKGGIGWQPSAAINVGHDTHPLASFRLQVQYAMGNVLASDVPYTVTSELGTQFHYKGNITTRFGLINTRALYMLNILNLWSGYPKQSRLKLYLQGGPSYARIVNENTKLIKGEMWGGNTPLISGSRMKGRQSMGAVAGLSATYSLAPRWDLTFDNMLQYNFNHKHFLPTIDRSKASQYMFDFGLGIRYSFKY